MSSAMSSAHIFVLLLVAVLHVFVQGDSGQMKSSATQTKSEVEVAPETGHSTGSAEHAKLSQDENNLSELFKKIVNEWNTYYTAPKINRTPRTKRWAEIEKRPGYFNTYSQPRSYSRYRYPSNLMALLRGTKRGWSDEPSTGRWKYPSNLMVLLRGKKNAMEDEEDDQDEEPQYLEEKALGEVMKRMADGWRYFLEGYSPDISAKRSAFYGYDDDRSSVSRRPFGARQFLMWNGGRYVLG